MRALLAVTLVVLVSVSGCLGAWDKEPDYDAVEQQAINAWTQTREGFANETMFNTRLVAYHNGVDDSGDANAIPAGGYYTEIALHDDRVYLARGNVAGDDRGEYGGFVIIDIQDITRPTFVGAYDSLTGSDIEVNHDASLAFFGTQRNTVEEVAGGLQFNEDGGAAPRGIHVVDISDPTAPSQVNFVPLPFNGVHTITYHQHENGNEYLLVATYDFSGNTVASDDAPPLPVGANQLPDPNPVTQRVIIYQIQDESGQAITQVGEYSVRDVAPEGKLYFPHDTYVEVHPLTGDTLMYVSYWDLGLHVVDITDPASPVALDTHRDFTPSTRGNIHYARPLDIMPGQRHVTVTEPEIISADETGYFWLIDTTDPKDIHKLGPGSYWTLPGDDIVVSNLDYSPHNFDVRNGIISLAHNMAGVWFVDVSDEENSLDPKTTGYYMANTPRENSPKSIPYSWGTRWLDDTHVLVSDEGTGLHIVEYLAPTFP